MGFADENQRIARALAEDNLSYVNSISDKVTPRNSVYTKYIKRCLDIVISLLAIIVTLPINALLAVLTFFDVGRPIFFYQSRIGKDGKPFTLVKFRNMTNATDENGKLLPPKQRVTKLGRFVRRTSLDELLNFYSILKGDMSIIGPRPLLPEFMDRYSERHKMRHVVRPGLECPPIMVKVEMPELAQGEKRSYQKQFENDVWYVEHVSFLLDCRLVLHLFKMTFNFRKRKKNGDTAGYFMGYDEHGYAIGRNGVPAKYIDSINAKSANDGLSA